MSSSQSSDVSLYEIALSSDRPSLILQVSPTTLKSVITSFIDLLVEQKIPAIVWAKLPRGEVWQVEIERYTLLTSLLQAGYLFKSYRDDSGDEAGMVTSAIAPTESPTSNQDATEYAPDPRSPVFSIHLPADSPLRREYFLMVWSAHFQGLILAHRPRSAFSAKTPVVEADTPSDAGNLTTEDNQERRQHLLMLFSLDSELIERILAGIDGILTTYASSEANSPVEIQPPLSSAQVVAHWQQQMLAVPIAAPNLQVLEQLFTRQLQRQEELWQRSSIYRKQAEAAESLQLHNEELNTAIRLKNDFLNNVGQELRTPLTTIKTALTLLNSPSIKPPQRQKYMDLIAKECDRQSSLITSLLDLVQLEQVIDQSDLQPIRVSEVVPGVVSIYQPVAEEKGVMLAYTVPEDLPAVSCMTNWLKQIVINLLNNGIKFTPRGGQVWVRAKQQGDYVQLEFRDSGVGIAPGEIPKIFERFYRVRQAAEESSGAGLGLTIVQQLLMHCGGSISVKSRLGEGSTFNVLLPVHKLPEQP